MSYAIVFSSKTGNTKLLADTLHACLPQENCCYFGTPDPAAMEADDLYVGFWTDKGNADESTLDFLKQVHGKNIFLFGTAGFGGSEEYFNKILKKVGEESAETIIAAKNGVQERTVEEISDLLYHLMVLLAAQDIPLEAVLAELERRSRKIGNLKQFHVSDHNT